MRLKEKSTRIPTGRDEIGQELEADRGILDAASRIKSSGYMGEHGTLQGSDAEKNSKHVDLADLSGLKSVSF